MQTIDVNLSGPGATADTFRGPSSAIWADCPWLEFLEDPSKGWTFWDDFVGAGNIPTAAGGAIAQGLSDKWSVYAYQGATIVDGALEGGVITMGSDGDNEGVALGPTAGAARIVTTSTLALNKKLWLECRIARSSVTATKGDFFAGLIDGFLTSGLPAAAVPITTTDNTLATKNLLGFHLKGNTPTEVNLAFCLSGDTVNYPTNMTTILADTGNSVLTDGAFVKLGFIFDPDAPAALVTAATARQTAGTLRKKLLRVFANGLESPTFLTTDDIQNATSGQAFPTGFMGPSLAVMNQTGSTPPTMSVDWFRVAQRANS